MKTGILTKLIDGIMTAEKEPKRDYLGASSIGDYCERKAWYYFNGYEQEPMTPSRRRTLEIGKRLESLVLQCLEDAGLCIARPNEENLFLEVIEKDILVFRGHLDAIWLVDIKTQAIIEVKTAKDSSYRVFVNKGLKIWYPVYYAQVQAYMGMSGIHQAYIVVINKDTSEIFDEAVEFDEIYYESLKYKAKRIINAKEPLAKINENPNYFACRMCNFRGVCHVK